MQSFLANHNRDFETYILDLIGDYAGSELGFASTRLRFFVNRERYLGTIRAEVLWCDKVFERKWLVSCFWVPIFKNKFELILSELNHVLQKLKKCNIKIRKISREVETAYRTQAVSDYKLVGFRCERRFGY